MFTAFVPNAAQRPTTSYYGHGAALRTADSYKAPHANSGTTERLRHGKYRGRHDRAGYAARVSEYRAPIFMHTAARKRLEVALVAAADAALKEAA